MRQVEIHNGIIEYFGNKIGYVSDRKAVVDEMFKKSELEEYLRENENLEVIWNSGVYDRIIQGNTASTEILKKCRIYQLKPEVDAQMKFIGYRDLLEGGFGRPDIKNYVMVFDGNVETNDLDKIYIHFNSAELPQDYEGHSLSKSDIIELYDESGSEYFYVDKFGFVKLELNVENEITESEQLEEPQKLQELQQMQDQKVYQEVQEKKEPQESDELEVPDNSQQGEDEQENSEKEDEFFGEDFSFTM